MKQKTIRPPQLVIPGAQYGWRWEVSAVILLTMVGAVLRLYHLGRESIWLDEAYTINMARLSLESIWDVVITSDVMPPLFYWMEHFILLVGNSEVMVRLLPAIFGILVIPVIYFVGKEFFDGTFGVILASAFAFSPFLISYSQEARPYSLLLLACAIVMWMFLRAMKTNSQLDWILFSLASAFAFWSHFYSVIFIFPLVGFAIYKFYPDIKQLGFSIMIGVALVFPLIFAIYNVVRMRTASAPSFGDHGIAVISTFFDQISWKFPVVSAVFLILFIIGLAWSYKNDKEKAILLTWMIFSGFIISLILASIIPMKARYLIFLTIPFFLGVVMSYWKFIEVFPKKYSQTYVVLGMILCFAVASVPFYATYYENYTKEDWRGFSKDLAAVTNSGDTVVIIPGYISQPFDFYYSNFTDETIEVRLPLSKNLGDLYIPRKTGIVYYVITSDIQSANPTGETMKWLKTNANYVGRTREGITVWCEQCRV